MNMPVMFLLVIFAVFVWWLLLQKLDAKPWLVQGAIASENSPYPPKVIALGVFLAVITALFSLFAAAYHMRMAVPDWAHLPLPKILWVNTLLLAMSSAALQWAWTTAQRFPLGEKYVSIRHCLTAGFGFALAFLVGQWLAWRQLDANGFYFSCTPASAFFYLLTGLHGLHVFGGIVVLGKTTAAVYRDDYAQRPETNPAIALSIKLCTIYWHYLLLIWLALFALLAAT